ncbi:HTH-type transcriptional repressor KstR2 [Thermoflexales bacterium]|nr:HTH-type transcriptional repressor KstR2 [Thermoflexales bacterium]
MPPPFTEKEKVRLRQKMLRAARDLFARKGLKKTSLEDLTSSVGIAKSTFYVFFESKEALFLEVLAEDGPAVEARLRAELDKAGDAREGLERLLQAIVQELETNALTRRMLTHPDELQLLVDYATPEQLAASNSSGVALIVPYLQARQRQGEVIKGDPILFARAISAVSLLTLHRDKIGADQYDAVLNTLIKLLAKALTTPE